MRRVQFTPDMLPSDLTGTMTLRGGELVVPPRPRVHQRAARRRDQPHAAEDAGGAARGDAGAPGDDRRRAAPAGCAVPRDRHAEPDRVRGHLPAARGAARPLPAAGRRRLPERRGGAAHARARARRRRPRRASSRSARWSAPRRSARWWPRRDATRGRATRSRGYVVALVRRTRELPSVALGASPRAAVHLLAAAQASARLRGRAFVTPDDVAELAVPVLAHRLVMTPEAELERFGAAGRGARRARRGAGAALRARPMTPDHALRVADRRRWRAGGARPAGVGSRWPLLLVALAADARRRPRGAPRAARASARLAQVLSRGVPARLQRAGVERATRAACCCASRRRPRSRCDARTRSRRAVAARSLAVRRGRHSLPGWRARASGRSGSRAGTTASASRMELLVYPDLLPRAPARAAPAPGPRGARRAPAARAARARHRLRVDPRVLAGRRHPPGQLARERAARPADEQPVPGRAGPRRDLPARQRPADGGARGRAARHAARRGARRGHGGGARGRRARRPLRRDRASTRRSAAMSQPRRLGGRRVVRALFDLAADAGGLRLRARVPARRAARGARSCSCSPTSIDEHAARSLVSAAPMLARRHAVVVASVGDPALEQAASRAARRRAASALAALSVRARARTRGRAHPPRGRGRRAERRPARCPSAACRPT